MSNELLSKRNFTSAMSTHFELKPAVRVKFLRAIADPFAEQLKRKIRLRRRREAAFGAELFADPAWDMMLDLCLASELGRTVSVSSLCIASAVPPTTALRWINALETKGIVERQPDPDDQRRVFISLSTDAHTTLKRLLCQWLQLPAPDGSLPIARAS